MADIAELQTKLSELTSTVTDTAARIDAGFKALLDKINAGPAPVDTTAEVATVQSNIDALKAITVPAVPA